MSMRSPQKSHRHRCGQVSLGDTDGAWFGCYTVGLP